MSSRRIVIVAPAQFVVRPPPYMTDPLFLLLHQPSQLRIIPPRETRSEPC